MSTPFKFIFFCLASAVIPAANAAVATNTFQVQLTILSSCSVSQPVALNMGSVMSNATTANGSTSMTVTCSRTTPYFVGLAPSSANGGGTTGNGFMAGTTGNTDKVPYQLNQDSAGTKPWGNTATSSSAGNGVGGTGSGLAQNITVYAVAPNANFKPDTYSDTVTINVNY
ncbi:TPA: spore coat protein U domain-containing protein [Kluyvera ascorbata]|nr:spore coat protein U domain-containing protein [Kluyvera ascorbata]